MTLGVGENRIIFMVVDISHTEPWTVNSYSLVILRLPVTHGEEDFDPTMDHQVCSLKQVIYFKLHFRIIHYLRHTHTDLISKHHYVQKS